MNGKDLKPKKATYVVDTTLVRNKNYSLEDIKLLQEKLNFIPKPIEDKFVYMVDHYTINRYMKREDILRLVCVNGKRIA